MLMLIGKLTDVAVDPVFRTVIVIEYVEPRFIDVGTTPLVMIRLTAPFAWWKPHKRAADAMKFRRLMVLVLRVLKLRTGKSSASNRPVSVA
jgi:hypothetical protein